MLLNQEVTVVTETDPLTLWISVGAVAVALCAAVFTYLQGRAIHRIESREHEWEAEDRRSAAIRVLTQSEWLRLQNTGRAAARNVVWSTPENGSLYTVGSSVDVIHPGEHYDVEYMVSGLAREPDPVFTVSWSDERGRHTTERILSV